MEKESNLSPKPCSRIGWVVEIHPDNSRVKVDFEDNPYGQPIWAALGRAFATTDIYMAIDNGLDCRIDFVSNDLSTPILINIYTSLLEQKEIVIKAKRISIEGEQDVVLRSGYAQTHLNGVDGRITSKATNITSQADNLHKIQAKKIALN